MNKNTAYKMPKTKLKIYLYIEGEYIMKNIKI